MIQVTMKVAFKVTTCLECGKKVLEGQIIVWTQSREKNFGRGDFKLCVLPMGLHS